jgi:CheY-like chemotaxis protein
VVDDEADAREMLSVLLAQAGAEVVTAASSAETLALLAGEVEARFGARPDVLIADIAMPDGDGFDLIRGVREMEAERGSRIPAIALTAYAGEEDRARALSEGYQMHIAKPVRLSVLAEAVARLVRGA